MGVRVAHAQNDARISLGVGGGAGVPFGPSSRFAPRWVEPDFNGSQGETMLTHYRPAAGMMLHLEILIQHLHIRYNFHRYGWRSDTIACTPADDNTGIAYLRPDGEFNDRTMSYHCGGDQGRIARASSRRPLMMHDLGVGWDFQAVRAQYVIPYAHIQAGLLLTTFHISDERNTPRLGMAFKGGGGLYVPIDQTIGVYVEAMYALHVMSRGDNYGLRAKRAVEAHKSIMSVLFDPMHALQFSLGLRVRIR